MACDRHSRHGECKGVTHPRCRRRPNLVAVFGRRRRIAQALLPGSRSRNDDPDVAIGVDVIIGGVFRGNLHVHHAHPFVFEDKVMAGFLKAGTA